MNLFYFQSPEADLKFWKRLINLQIIINESIVRLNLEKKIKFFLSFLIFNMCCNIVEHALSALKILFYPQEILVF